MSNPTVAYLGKQLKLKQEKLLTFLLLLAEEDKVEIFPFRYNTELWKEVLHQQYYTDEQREGLNKTSDWMKFVVERNPKFKFIYERFMHTQFSTSSVIITKARLEEYLQRKF